MTARIDPNHSSAPRIDGNALQTNQVAIVVVSLLAFVLGTGNGGAVLVAALALSLAIGAARPGSGPIQLLYRHALIPAGIVRPSPRADDPAPHRFAQALGAGFLAASAVLLFLGATTIGWILGGIVVALALTNLVFGFCAGCFVFLHLRRVGVPA